MRLLLGSFALVAAVVSIAYEGLASNRRSIVLFAVGFIAGWLA